MGYFDRICSKAKNIADKTGESAEKLIDKSVISVEIIKTEKELKKAYLSLGKRTYNNAKKEISDDKRVSMLVEEIDILKEKLLDLKLDSQYIECCTKCKNCGAYNDKDETVCQNCQSELKPFEKAVYSMNFSDKDKE